MRDCDLVMKGGITSGVVYPSAVAALHEDHRFRSIGGTSAGAVAAAVTAAAEYDRDGGGFDQVAAMGRELQQDGVLLGLFQPAREARPLFDLVVALQRERRRWAKPLVVATRLLRHLWPSVAVVVLLLLMLLGYMVLGFNGELQAARAWAWPVVLLFATLAGTVALVIATALRVTRLAGYLPERGFGMCSGMSEPGYDTAAFTPWLHQWIQRCAGRRPGDAVLTFGDLRAGDVNLEMVTTDVSAARPVRLPAGLDGYLFSTDELARLFPRDVVDHVKHHGAQHDGLIELSQDDLPVVVATRMSLSFPLLIAAVPAWRDGERHWLSDGGIASNFPIHFFDAWVPRWPTFGLDFVPAARNTEITSTVRFVSQILDTMQNWRDTLQAELPGYAERIRAVPLEPDEGGMNLAMPPETITGLARKGGDAANALSAEFDWDAHRFARYALFMRLLQSGLLDGVDPAFRALEGELRDGLPGVARDEETFPPAWCRGAARSTSQLLDTVAKWGTAGRADFTVGPPPEPEPTMRVTPRV